MTPAEFKAEQAHLGIKNKQLAALLRVSERAVEKWRQGTRAIPGPVTVIFRLLRLQPGLIKLMEDET